MSRTIDTRIVSMRFDNRHFESNVQTSLSTLDKLKQKLNLTGASKGLDNLSAAAAKVNLSPIGAAAEQVGLKFNAMYSMADQALRNITNSAMMYGKRIVSALTIDPIKTGLSEYETKMNAIQVIQANTRDKNSMDDIVKALDELNTYADKTIYNFTQMTSNMGKFTAQGFDVYEAANAVKGLANLAAASGASAEDMARATYQMSQALGGTIRLMDWNSLRNANMATQDLKNTLIDLAKVNGIAIDDMIEKHGTFEQTLSEGWLSGKMFSEAMNIYSGVYSEAELKAKGFTDAQVKNFMELAAMAESAATEVKTFTQLWDVLKETAQSGWTQTWEILVGDFATAKRDLTALQNYFSEIINGWSDIRNSLFGGAFNMKSPWSAIMDKLDEAGLGKLKEAAKAIGDVTEKVEYFQDIVNRVWKGDFMNSDTGRYDLLTAAGYNPKVVQDLVNLGYGYKITIEDIEASHKKFGLTMEGTAASTEEVVKSIDNLSEEQLRNAGLTEGEIRLYKALQEEAKRTGKSVNEIAKEMSEKDGRTLLIEAMKNAWSGLTTILKAVKEAWSEVFPPMTVVQLYNIIKGINQFSQHLKVGGETAEKIKRTFKGLFALLDIVTTITGGALKIALKLIGAIIGDLNIDILELTARIGDAIVSFRDWIDETIDFGKIFKTILPYISEARDAISKWFTDLRNAEDIPKFLRDSLLNGLKNVASYVKKAASNIGDFFVQGVSGGLKDGVKKIVQKMIDIGKRMLEAIKNVLEIHSPSRKGYEIGRDFLLGIWNGLKDGALAVWSFVKTIGLKCIEIIKNLDFGKIMAAAVSVGMFITIWKIADLLKMLFTPLTQFGDVLQSVENMFDSIADSFKAKTLKAKSQALVNFAVAVAILAGSVALLAFIPRDKLWGAVAAIAVLSAVVVALAIAVDKMTNGIGLASHTGLIDSQVLTLLAISGSLLLVAIALKKLSGIDSNKILPSIALMGAAIIAIGGVYAAITTVSYMAGPHASRVGSMLMKMALSLLLMIGVVKMASNLNSQEVVKALAVIGYLELFFAAIMAVSYLAGEHASKAGSMMIKMSLALIVMIGVVKLVSKLDPTDLNRGLEAILKMELLFAGMIILSRIAGTYASKAGSMLIKMSIAIAVMVGIIKLISFIDDKELKRGLKAISILELFFMALVGVSYFAGEHAVKAGRMLITMSVALAILTGLIYILGNIDADVLAKGLGVVGTVIALFGGLVYISKYAQATNELRNVLIVMTVTIGILVAAIGLLSFIDPKRLAGAVIAISVVIGMLALLMKMLEGLGSLNAYSVKTLITLGVIMAAFAVILGVMAKLKIEASIKTATALSEMLLAIAVVTWALSKIKIPEDGVKDMFKLSGVMAALAGVILILAVILGVMDKLNAKASIESAIALSAMLLAISGAVWAISKAKMPENGVKDIFKFVGVMGALVGVVAVLGIVLGLLNKYDLNASLPQVLSLSLMLYLMAGVVAALGLIGKHVIAGGNASSLWIAYGALMATIGGIVVIAGVIAGLNCIPKYDFESGVNMLALVCKKMVGPLYLLAILTAVMGAVGTACVYYGGGSTGLWVGYAALMATIGGITVIAGIIAGLNCIPKYDFVSGAEALALMCRKLIGPLYLVSILTGVMAVVGLACIAAGGTAGLWIGYAALMATIGGIAIIAGVVGALDLIPGHIMERGANALVTMTQALINILKSLLIFVEAIGECTAAIFGLPNFLIISSIFSTVVGVLTALTFVLGLLLELIPNSTHMMETGLMWIRIISGLILDFGWALMYMCEGFTITSAISSVAIVSSLYAMVPLIVAMGVLAIAIGTICELPIGQSALDKGVAMLYKLTAVLTVIGLSVAIISNAVPLFTPAIKQLALTEPLILALGAIAIALGSLCSIPGVDTVLDKGLDIAKKITRAIVDIGLIFADGVIEHMRKICGSEGLMSEFGTALSEFMLNAQGFFDGAKAIGNDAKAILVGVGTIVTAVAGISAADFIDDIASILPGTSSLADLGSQLSDFVENAKSFIDMSKTIDEGSMNGVKSLTEAILTLTAASFLEGIKSWVKGSQDIETFGAKLPLFATNIKDFITNLGTDFDSDIGKIRAQNAAAVITALSKAAESIPGEGGWWQKIVGTQDIASFAGKLPLVGESVTNFVTSLGELFDNGDMVNRAKNGAKVIVAIAKAAHEIPAQDGWWQKIVGGKDIATYAAVLPTLGQNLSDFVTNLGATFDEESCVTRASNGAKVIAAIAKASESIGGGPDWWKKLVGTDVETFAAKLPNVGTAIKGFVDEIGELSEESITSANTAIEVLNSVTALNASGLKEAASNLPSVSKVLPGFGENIKTFALRVGGDQNVSLYLPRALQNINAISNMLKNIKGVDNASVSNFKKALTDLAKTSVDDIVKAFSNQNARDKIQKAAMTLMNYIVKGIKEQVDDIETASKGVVSGMLSTINTVTNYNAFYTLGKWLVEGFAAGIEDNASIAATAAAAMVNAAEAAAKEAQDSNSPSKVFYGLGGDAGDGYINALYDYADRSYNAGYAMADAARNGLTNAVSRIKDAIDSDMDMQPTIRPVVDLDAVTAGANQMNRLFSLNPSVGTLANVRSINAAMNRMNQNGANDGIIAAIQDLKDHVNRPSGDTYNFGDISYDDGSNIAEAVQTLVRAARVERRR